MQQQDASRKVKSPNTAEGREVKEGGRDEVKVVEDGKEGEIEGTGLRDDGAGVVLQCPECQHRCVFDGRGDLTSSLPSLSHVARSTAMYKVRISVGRRSGWVCYWYILKRLEPGDPKAYKIL